MKSLGVVAVAALVLATGCGQATKAAPARGLSGTMELSDEKSAGSIYKCQFGAGGYGDIKPGAQVTVTDGSSHVLALGTLGAGEVLTSVPVSIYGKSTAAPTPSGCRFPLVVNGIPDVPFYGVEVAHRGVQRYSRQDLDSAKWTVHLTLG
jgi:hypothetical protein